MEPLSLPISGAHLLASADAWRVLEIEVLPRYLPQCRWFASKARTPVRFQVEQLIPLLPEKRDCVLGLVRVEYESGPAETYLLPLGVLPLADAPEAGNGALGLIARFSDGTALIDAIYDGRFRAALMRLIQEQQTVSGAGNATLAGERGAFLEQEAAPLESRVLKVEQSNSSVIYGDCVFMKLYRKLEEGMNPDVEITRRLSEACHFPYVPPFAGAVELRGAAREPRVLALALGMVPNQGDAWAYTLEQVAAFFEKAAASSVDPSRLGALDDPQAVELAGEFPARVRLLGQRTAEMHLALASATDDPAFAPEPFTEADQRRLGEAVRASIERVLELIGSSPQGAAAELLAARGPLLALAERISARAVPTVKTRTHGDYHLGQVLYTGDDFVIIDFEGEPQRSLAERREKRSPLRDVAGMLRSFHYAAHSGLGQFESQRERLEPWAEWWAQYMSRQFLQAWKETAGNAPFAPADQEGFSLLLDAFLLEKAVYEIGYELNNRPAWVHIPVRGVLQIVRSQAGGA